MLVVAKKAKQNATETKEQTPPALSRWQRLLQQIDTVRPSGLFRLYMQLKREGELRSKSLPLYERISLIRDSTLSQLTSDEYMVDLIAKLGLYPHQDWSRAQFPKELWPSCGQGLGIWQYPSQFGRYLAFLGRLHKSIQSYLEIGVAGGGTFVTTMEYLRKLNPSVKGIGIDPALLGHVIESGKSIPTPFHSITKTYMDDSNHNCQFLLGYSHQVIPSALRRNMIPSVVDLVLIDGDHGYAGCNADYDMVKLFANIIVFHDIVNDDCSGVVEIWHGLKNFYPLSEEFDFYEFIDQYPECHQRQKKRYLGIGVMVRKVWLKAD
jgi:hypothetical protein